MRIRRARWGRAIACAALVASLAIAACTVAPPATTRAPSHADPVAGPPTVDPALVSLSIMPPGNGGIAGPTAVHLDDQRAMYDRLDDVVADGLLTDEDLPGYFKEAGLGASGLGARPPVRVDEPTDGVRIEWDRWGVPRVIGTTAEEVAWGAGWAVADARLLIAEIGRVLGRAGTIEMGGSDNIVNAVAQILTLPQVSYTDAELLAELDAVIASAGPDGPRMLASLDAFVDGLNAWLDTHLFPQALLDLGLQWRHWTRADVLAVGITVDDIFGAGGGDEVGNARARAQLDELLGTGRGAAAYDQLRNADEASATTHVERAFPYPQFAPTDGAPSTATNVVDPAAVAVPDRPTPVAGPSHLPAASNYIAVAGDRTASGTPVLVGGPQTSYFTPQLLFEMELQGGGYDVRGVTFPGLGPWVVIGRGRDFAWTATAGRSDLTDERVELLCEPDGTEPSALSLHYSFDGECRPMTRPDAAPLTAWRTVHGPVVGRTTVDGKPVAISRQRFSRFQIAHAVPAFWALNQGRVHGAESFAPTMKDIPMSFNWVYVDAHDVAYFHSGWYPVRAAGVDPDLPSWGTGEWEWKGRLDWTEQPQQLNPSSGVASSWNNKVAPGWREPDDNWSAGSAQRVDLLARRTTSLRRATPAQVVAAAQDAATVDLRGELVLPEVLRLIDGAAAPSSELAALRDELADWVAAGAHRRDRDDGFYDDHAVAVMDALFEPLVRAVYGEQLGPYLDDLGGRRPKVLDNPPSQTGSAFAYGWFSQVVDDLRRVREGAEPDAVVFCGSGDPAACRARLWDALEQARTAAGAGRKWVLFDRIRFIPYIFDFESVRWVNRPTFQQVVAFGAPAGPGS